MKILVTGGAGFIGSHVADGYLAAGHKVVVLDDLSGGKRSNVPPKAKLVVADIRDTKKVHALFKKERFDVVNSHAAQMSVPDSVKDPRHDADINVLGVLNLLEAGRLNGLKKFIHVSSGGTVYGSPKKFPATEAFPIQPESPYGITKAVGETYLRFYRAQHGLDYSVLRYSNVYGPRQMPHGEAGVVAIFIQRLLKGQDCTIFGDGSLIRDYVYVGDVARASLLCLKKGSCQAYNIGTNRPTTVKELYTSIAKALGLSKAPVYGPPRAGDVKANWLSWAKAHKELGWSPKVALDKGIRETVAFFKAGAKR
ncbi:MAG TPA: NAD-dependent epimerase/dehydratase family protein [bacterium]|jgi:UDP-glucose 4-epimerase|nr:NAD-dependent epimerase/dehydratase family protein [bacterium]